MFSNDYLREGLISEIKVMQKNQMVLILYNFQMQCKLITIIIQFKNIMIVVIQINQQKIMQNKQKTQPEKNAVKFMIDILNGYIQLIKNGIIHRHLKPANILIDKGIFLFKLADFGFAKCVDNFKKDMLVSLVGTTLYMSPQILDNKKYISKTDIWSISFIFYEALFGKAPWTSRSSQELIKNIKNQPLQFKAHKFQKCLMFVN